MQKNNGTPMDPVTEEQIFHTHRLGDRHGSLVTVVVLPPPTQHLVRELVEGRIPREPGAKPYRWGGPGMNTQSVESLRYGLFCPACGLTRVQCKCEAKINRLADKFGNDGGGKRRRPQVESWQMAAQRAAAKMNGIPGDAFVVAP